MSTELIRCKIKLSMSGIVCSRQLNCSLSYRYTDFLLWANMDASLYGGTVDLGTSKCSFTFTVFKERRTGSRTYHFVPAFQSSPFGISTLKNESVSPQSHFKDVSNDQTGWKRHQRPLKTV